MTQIKGMTEVHSAGRNSSSAVSGRAVQLYCHSTDTGGQMSEMASSSECQVADFHRRCDWLFAVFFR
jgi:hypothetical protein